jgi:hypothetical protein
MPFEMRACIPNTITQADLAFEGLPAGMTPAKFVAKYFPDMPLDRSEYEAPDKVHTHMNTHTRIHTMNTLIAGWTYEGKEDFRDPFPVHIGWGITSPEDTRSSQGTSAHDRICHTHAHTYHHRCGLFQWGSRIPSAVCAVVVTPRTTTVAVATARCIA